jgi:hypothetical protein
LESGKPLEDCQQLGPLFGDKERRLFLVMAVADGEVEALFALLQALESLRKKAGWPKVRTDLSIGEVRALQLRGVIIVDGHIKKLDLSMCGLSGNVALCVLAVMSNMITS